MTMMEITGRDSYIIVKALAYAIEAIDRLPFDAQERSDREDMIALLERLAPVGEHRERRRSDDHALFNANIPDSTRSLLGWCARAGDVDAA